MKILLINSVCGLGSTGRICTDLAQMLEKEEHDCKIAYGRGTVSPENQKYAIKIGSKKDFYIHAGLSRVFDNTGFYSKHATKKLIAWIENYNPDVIHLHNIHGYYINIKLLFNYLKTCKKKIIWTLHDCWSFTGHCSHFDSIQCNKWKDRCFSCPLKKEYPKSNFRDNSKKNYQLKKELFTGIEDLTIVTPSQWLADVVKQSFLKEYEVKVIHNGIDLNVFKPISNNFKKLHHIENKFMILGVASVWSEKKGLNDFIELSKILDERFQIVLVGLNQKQMQKIPKNIIGIERTNSANELAQIYTAADVFVNPSIEETMGLTTVEAIACTTPVIVYNRTAVPEVVTPEVGKIVSNYFEIKNILDESIENKKKLDDISSYIHEFDKKEMLKKYMQLYLNNHN